MRRSSASSGEFDKSGLAPSTSSRVSVTASSSVTAPPSEPPPLEPLEPPPPPELERPLPCCSSTRGARRSLRRLTAVSITLRTERALPKPGLPEPRARRAATTRLMEGRIWSVLSLRSATILSKMRRSSASP